MEPLEALRKAGKIAAGVREEIKVMVEPGVRVIDICDTAESLIIEKGGRPCFPCNVDIDQVAAHYVSPLGDSTTIQPKSIVKIDIGVHIEGYNADTAVTVCLDPFYEPMVEAAEAGLKAGIIQIRDGVNSKKVGAAIEDTIRSRGYKPIRNLTGHKMTRYVLHAGKAIPNISTMRGGILEEGEVYAVEPFSVPINAAGQVIDGPRSNIYRFLKKRSVKGIAKEILRFIQSEYRTLPFASRWLLREFPGEMEAFNELLKSKCIMSYPQLVEKSGKVVAQAEHTVIVTKDGAEITTV